MGVCDGCGTPEDVRQDNIVNELLATAMTEDLAEWLRGWLGESDPVGFNTKSDIYLVVMERLTQGVEV